MFEIKKKAAEKLKEIIKGAEEGFALRIYIERGCCSDNINMEFVSTKLDGDIEQENEGFKYYLSADASKTLDEAWMDADEKGNVFIEGIGPKPGSCCCGEDHAQTAALHMKTAMIAAKVTSMAV